MMELNRYLDPVPPVFPDKYKESLSFKYISEVVDIVENLLGWQNEDGSWGKKGDIFNQVYHTTQVLQCLLRVGLSPEGDVIRKALDFLDKVKKPSTDFRAIFFLYASMKRYDISEMELYLTEIKEEQGKDGSLLFSQDMKKTVTADQPHWKEYKLHRGSSVFHALHELHTISLIDYKNISFVQEIVDKLFSYLENTEKKLNTQKDLHILPDSDSNPDPQFTSWWLCLRIRYSLSTPHIDETINWILEGQKDGGWGETLVDIRTRIFATCFVISDLCFLAETSGLSHEIQTAVRRGMEWLVSNRDHWKNDENYSAIVGRTLIDGTVYLCPNNYPEVYCMSIYQHLRERIALKKKIMTLNRQKTYLKGVAFILAALVPVIGVGALGSHLIIQELHSLNEFMISFQGVVSLICLIIAVIGIINRKKIKELFRKKRIF